MLYQKMISQDRGQRYFLTKSQGHVLSKQQPDQITQTTVLHSLNKFPTVTVTYVPGRQKSDAQHSMHVYKQYTIDLPWSIRLHAYMYTI